MIDRRCVLLGGLAGLVVPGAARPQPGPNGPGPPGGAGAGQGNAQQGSAGTTGSRIPAGGNRDSAPMQNMGQAGTVQQPPRIAALILSQSYRSTPAFALANTNRDAALIARSFQQLRFDRVAAQSDGSAGDTVASIISYLRGIDANTIALVYVAGHGMEVAGENLLLLEGASAFLSLQALVQVLQQRAGVTILFLDACRNNPLGSLAGAAGPVSRAIALPDESDVRLQTVSLADLRAAPAETLGRLRAFSLQGSGIKIVFSTDPANVALDGIRGSRNSPFAQALARHIRDPLSLDDIISLTTGDVIRATHRAQSPWSQGSIDRPIFLSGRRRREQASFD